MGIDSRIAHGVAGRHLDDALNNSTLVLERIRRVLDRRSTWPSTSKGARRELREIRRPIAKHSLWWMEGEDRNDGPFLAWLGARGEEDGTLALIRSRVCPIASRTRPVQMEKVGTLSLHAMARCFQRNGTLSWDAVKPTLADAAANLVLMSEVAQENSLLQLAVPAHLGLFVGDFDAKGELILETYLLLDEAVPSRWIPVRKATLGAIASSGMTQQELYETAAFGSSPLWSALVADIGESLTSFWWLREAYEPQLDPLSVAWNDYQARAKQAA